MASRDQGRPCQLGDWTAVGVCETATLTQKWQRAIVTAPGFGQPPCDTMEEWRPCVPTHCEMSKWTPWTDCNADGYKTRTRIVIQQPESGGRECPHGLDKVQCCEDDCRMSEWSNWTCDATTSSLTRSRMVVQPAMLPRGKRCSTALTEVGTECGGSDCVLNSVEEDKGPWGACIFDEQTTTHSQTKDLGIKTDVSGGGKPCTPRAVSRPCPLQDYLDWFAAHNYKGDVKLHSDTFDLLFGKPWTANAQGVSLGSMLPYDSHQSPTTLVFSGGDACPFGTLYSAKLTLRCGIALAFDPAPHDDTECGYKGTLTLPTLEICTPQEPVVIE